MIFAVDIGNTNIVIGIMDKARKVRFSGRIPTNKQGTKEEFANEITGILDGACNISLADIEGTIISSVVPEVTYIIRDCMESITGKEVLVVNNGMETGIEITTDNPEKVGTDLIVDAVAASNEYGGTIIIFDMGTATTCSVIDNRRYLGTIIIPGVVIAYDALAGRASQLPKVDFREPEKLIGTNTVESMQSGIIYGTAAMIDGLTDRVERELGCETKKVTVIATGGIAGLIVPHCSRDIIYEPDLLLNGLWYLYDKNMKHHVNY